MATTSLLGGCASVPRGGSSTEGLINGASGCHAPAPNLARAYNRTYTVHGRSYTPLRSAVGYDQTGTASWYGWESGSTTSMGTRFNPRVFTAASRTLPLPTCVQVTNLDNGRSALVLVNDRGPFVDTRILDLSYGAAEALGVTRTGTAPVRIIGLPDGAPALSNGTLVASAGTAQAAPQLVASQPTVLPAEAQPQTRFPPGPGIVAVAPPSDGSAQAIGSTGAPPSTAESPPALIPSSPPTMEVQELPPLQPSPAVAAHVAPASPASQAPTPVASLPLPAVGPAPSASLPPDTVAPALAGPAQTFVQTGAFTAEANAEVERARLQAAGVGPVQIVPGVVRGQTYYRVQVGPLPGAAPDADLQGRLHGLGITVWTVVQQ